MPAPSHYELLGLAPGASADDLRQAFRVLSKRYHPDTTDLPLAEAERAFCQLQHAYSVLSDPQQRHLYDATLQASGPAPGRPLAVTVKLPDRRPLSGGEWLSLLLLGLATVFALVLGVGLAWLRGVDLVQWPSWWLEAR
jgi:curved DNA-binding protein CbpA